MNNMKLEVDVSRGDTQRLFLEAVRRNLANAAIIDRLTDLDLPDCYLVGGCLTQTVWNCISLKQPMEDIVDYDVFYYNNDDLSWDGEDFAIRRARLLFKDLGVDVQVRNQARVHLWYEQKFGVHCQQLRSTRDGIDHFLNRSSCFGIRRSDESTYIYAPFGFEDLYTLKVRPNCRRMLPDVYYDKAKRWTKAWPALEVIEWPSSREPRK